MIVSTVDGLASRLLNQHALSKQSLLSVNNKSHPSGIDKITLGSPTQAQYDATLTSLEKYILSLK